jgi:deazaflavin-dependent oxidoreductase (nitroreductase family)
MARFNRAVTNHLTLPLAGRAPYFGIVVHTGRKSGCEYRTPVNIFAARSRRFRVALTYGKDADWVRNAVAAGRVGLLTQGRAYELVDPEVVIDPDLDRVPILMRVILRALHACEFLEFRVRADGGCS